MSFSIDKCEAPVFRMGVDPERTTQSGKLARRGLEFHEGGATEIEQPKSRRRVDKDRIERATRESKALIDKERAARDEKTARLRQMRLARS